MTQGIPLIGAPGTNRSWESKTPTGAAALSRSGVSFLDSACLFWRFSRQSCLKNPKRQKGQPHSKTLARGPHSLDIGEALGVRLSFLALSVQVLQWVTYLPFKNICAAAARA